MGVLSVFLLVVFVIVSILLVLLVLVQNEDGDSLGGVFAGGSSSAFGSRSGNVLSRASTVLGAVFLVLSFALAVVNRTPSTAGVEQAGRETISSDDTNWWKGTDATAPDGANEPAAPDTAAPDGATPDGANEPTTAE